MTGEATCFEDISKDDLRKAFKVTDYVANTDIVTTAFLALRLGRPFLVEGERGAGKTELATGWHGIVVKPTGYLISL